MGSCISSQNHLDPDESLVSDISTTEGGPITRVPDDVLYSIFAFVAQIEPIRGIHDLSQQIPLLDNPSYSECLGWMRLSAVCRRWRVVLVTSAPLWADAVFYLPPEAASLALTRSGNAPLDMHIPYSEDLHSILRSKMVSSKNWGLPHTHRVRLLSLATTHASRMRKLNAADLTAQHYQDIFGSGSFNSLRVLVVRRSYYDDKTPAPTRDDIGRLHISAPNVYRAYLSAALPIALGDGPGLSFSLPGLRDLSVSTTLSRPTSIEQLRWIPSLIRGAAGLLRLKLHLPVDFYVNWKELCGDETFHLPALRAVELSGSLNAHLDDLFKQISTSIPPSVFSSSSGDMDRTNILEFVRTYGHIVAQSLQTHPLDTIYISRGTRNDFHAAFSVTAFSSKEVPGPYHSLEDLTQSIYSRAHHAARLSAFFSWLIMGDEDRAGDALSVLAPLLTQNSVKHLILDELSTTQWEAAVPGFMRSCLTKVTTLHCIDSRNPVGNQLDMYPCTAALRRLKVPAEAETQCQLPEHSSNDENHRAIATGSHPLSALKTVVVSMIAKPEEKYWTIRGVADVREWWDELIRGLTYRHEIGLRVHTLRIVGNWASEKLNSRMAKLDAKMLVRATALVDELVDERSKLPAKDE
ncbi:hypothetical protein PENSPDRAFT_693025 [Peniophora sp. CONT]|nr:hypothetical protein PENSPDRAFT_693025 [Peniophora sp. CONT]